MLRAAYIGLGCAFHVRGRSRHSIRRLRRATFWCLLVFTRNTLLCLRASGWSPRNSATRYGYFELFAYTPRRKRACTGARSLLKNALSTSIDPIDVLGVAVDVCPARVSRSRCPGVQARTIARSSRGRHQRDESPDVEGGAR